MDGEGEECTIVPTAATVAGFDDQVREIKELETSKRYVQNPYLKEGIVLELSGHYKQMRISISNPDTIISDRFKNEGGELTLCAYASSIGAKAAMTSVINGMTEVKGGSDEKMTRFIMHTHQLKKSKMKDDKEKEELEQLVALWSDVRVVKEKAEAYMNFSDAYEILEGCYRRLVDEIRDMPVISVGGNPEYIHWYEVSPNLPTIQVKGCVSYLI